MEIIKENSNKPYRPDFIKEVSMDSPFENVGGNFILKKSIQTSDYVQGKTGVKIDPTSKYSKIFGYGGNLSLYEAVVSNDGSAEFKTIQDAINAGKTKIFVRAGTYIITADISLPNGCELVGEDAKTTIITANNAAYQVKAIGASGSEFTGLHIANLTFSGSTDTDGALYFNYVDKSLIENCIFTSDNTTAGFKQINSDYNIATKNWSYCPFLIAGTHTRISLNVFILSTGTAIGGSGNPIYIENNVIYGATVGIAVNGKAIISNNYISNTTGNSITVATGPATITGNNIESAGGYSIYSTSSKNTITGNVINSSSDIGIFCYGTIQGSTISGNSITINGAIINGIKLLGLETNPATYTYYNIINSNFVSATADGILIDETSASVIIGNVVLTGASYSSIKINDSNSDSNIVVGNYCQRIITNNGTNTEIANNITP